jgi:Major Facilitator Superfamily
MLSLVVALGIAGSIADPNLAAIVPDLVAPEEVTGIISLMDLTERIARVAGPGLAEVVLLAAPTDTLFVIDAATFAVSGIALAALTRVSAPSPPPSPITSIDAPGEKVSARVALRANPDLRTALAVNGFGFFLNAVPALGMPLLLVHHLHAGAGAYGAVLAASGTGALLGNAVAARNRQPGAFVTRFCLAWAVAGLLLAATGMAPGLGWILAFSAGCALAVIATTAALLGRRSAPPTTGAVGRVGAPVVRPSCATRPITRCADRWSSEARRDRKDGAVVGADCDDFALWGHRGTTGRAFHGRVMSLPQTHTALISDRYPRAP